MIPDFTRRQTDIHETGNAARIFGTAPSSLWSWGCRDFCTDFSFWSIFSKNISFYFFPIHPLYTFSTCICKLLFFARFDRAKFCLQLLPSQPPPPPPPPPPLPNHDSRDGMISRNWKWEWFMKYYKKCAAIDGITINSTTIIYLKYNIDKKKTKSIE